MSLSLSLSVGSWLISQNWGKSMILGRIITIKLSLTHCGWPSTCENKAAATLTPFIRWEMRTQLPAYLEARNTNVSLSLCKIESKEKKHQNPVTNYGYYILAAFRDASGSTLQHLRTRRSVPVCVCLSAPSRRQVSKVFIKNRFSASQSRSFTSD